MRLHPQTGAMAPVLLYTVAVYTCRKQGDTYRQTLRELSQPKVDEGSGNALRCRCTLALPQGRARLIHHAEARLLQGYVQANILLHGCSPLPMPSPILSDLTPPESSRPQLPHVALTAVGQNLARCAAGIRRRDRRVC